MCIKTCWLGVFRLVINFEYWQRASTAQCTRGAAANGKCDLWVPSPNLTAGFTRSAHSPVAQSCLILRILQPKRTWLPVPSVLSRYRRWEPGFTIDVLDERWCPARLIDLTPSFACRLWVYAVLSCCRDGRSSNFSGIVSSTDLPQEASPAKHSTPAPLFCFRQASSELPRQSVRLQPFPQVWGLATALRQARLPSWHTREAFPQRLHQGCDRYRSLQLQQVQPSQPSWKGELAGVQQWLACVPGIQQWLACVPGIQQWLVCVHRHVQFCLLTHSPCV